MSQSTQGHGALLLGFKAQLHHRPAGWPWASYWLVICFYFLICKTIIASITLHGTNELIYVECLGLCPEFGSHCGYISLNPSQCLGSKEMLNKYFLMKRIHCIKTHLEQGMGIEVTASRRLLVGNGSNHEDPFPWAQVLPSHPPLVCFVGYLHPGYVHCGGRRAVPQVSLSGGSTCCFLNVRSRQKVKILNFLCRGCRFNPCTRN